VGRLASPEAAEIYTRNRQLRVCSVVTESRARRPTCGAAACQPPCVGIESEHHHCRQPRGGADVGVVPRHRTIGTDMLRFVRRDSCDTAPSVLVSSWVSPFVVHSKARAASINRWRKMCQEVTSHGRTDSRPRPHAMLPLLAPGAVSYNSLPASLSNVMAKDDVPRSGFVRKVFRDVPGARRDSRT
jgi:hypothetical protein